MRRMCSTGITSRQCAIFGLAGVAAFFVVASPALSADFTLKAPETTGEFRAFVSGGAFWTGGDPIPYGNSGTGFESIAFGGGGGFVAFDPTVAPNVGWNAGVGFDYRFASSPWHVNGQFRFGQSNGRGSTSTETFSGTGTDDNSHPTTTSGSASTGASLKETHWLVDFGGGYDLPIARNVQVNFGIRTARLSSNLTSPSTFALLFSDPLAAPGDPTSGSENSTSLTVQKSTFLGAGPRVGVEGSVPFGHFSFDYSANAAWLIGTARINSESTGSLSVVSNPPGTGTNLNLTGITSGSTYEKRVNVYNGDLLVGVSYWFTPAAKVALNYRMDAYFSPLRTFDINGNVISLDRVYHGPEIALSAKF
jgi:Legionella pneumophila major outer membrane protein precursor